MLAGWWFLNRYVFYLCITASFHYNMCGSEESSTSLAQVQACELVRRGRQKLITVLLPHTMVLQFVPYDINFYDNWYPLPLKDL
jgi:hypothetical protein